MTTTITTPVLITTTEPTGLTISGTATAGQVITLTGTGTANWQTPGSGTFIPGGDLTGTFSSQQVVSLSGTTGSVQAEIGSLGAGAGAFYASTGLIRIPNNNNAGALNLIIERNNVNSGDQNILGYSFGVLAFGNTAQVTQIVGNNVQLTTANGTPFVVHSADVTMQGIPTFQWSANTPNPLIKQLTQTSDAATNNLTIASQAAFASATGSNQNGSNLILTPGTSTGAGSGVGGKLVLNGGQQVNVVSKSATYSVDAGSTADYVILTTGNAFTITLPVPTAGRVLVIKDAAGNASTQNKTISQNASENIDGASTYVLNLNFASIELTSDGTNWFVTKSYNGTVI